MDVRGAVLSLTEDSQQRLWLLMGVPAPSLPNPVGDPARMLDNGIVAPVDLADHVIGVIDPKKPGWIATRRLDFFSGGFLPDGYAYEMTESDMGERSIVVVLLGL